MQCSIICNLLIFYIGILNRKKYVQQFYETFWHWQMRKNLIEPWAFLDCVLDETFKELKTPAAHPDSEPNYSRLISTIVERSSELQKLTIDCRSIKNPTSAEKITPLITSLSSLEHLTSLNLHPMEESHRPVLKLIGNACPLLTHLSISGFKFSANDIFSLILGDFADQLFPVNEDPKVWSEDSSSLEFLQAPSEILTPICFTLRHLVLSMDQEYYRGERTDKFYSLSRCIYPPSSSFT